MDFSGGTRKFPVAQETGEGRRAGVQPPPGRWSSTPAPSRGGEIPESSAPPLLGPQLRTFPVKNAFLKEESNLVTTAQEIVCAALWGGDIRGIERASQGQSWAWRRGKRTQMLLIPQGCRCHWRFSGLSTEAQTGNGNPKCLEASPEATSMEFLGNLLISHMAYTQYGGIQITGTRIKQAWFPGKLRSLALPLKASVSLSAKGE